MHGPREDGEDDVVAEMNVIPFIDICLVLLIIILMTAAADTKLAELKLPVADSTEHRDMNLAIVISVTHQVVQDASGKPVLDESGKPKPVLVNGKKDYKFFIAEVETPIAPKDLWRALKETQGDSKWSMMVIRTDKETPYEYLAMAMQCAQSLGVPDINLAVKDQNQAASEVAAN